MERLTAVQSKLDDYRGHNVQVLGVSHEDPAATAAWAHEIGVTFPILHDKDMVLQRHFGLTPEAPTVEASGGGAGPVKPAKGIVYAIDGEKQYGETVTTTEIPPAYYPQRLAEFAKEPALV